MNILKSSIVLLTGLSLSACGPDASQASTGPAQASALSVTTAVAGTREVRETLSAVGDIVSRQAPTLASEVSGQVIEVLADVGQTVAAGQILLRIDPSNALLERDSAAAELAQLSANLDLETRRTARLRKMHRSSAVSEDQLDEAQTRLKAMQASLKAAQAGLALAERRLAKTQISAPIDGVVQARHVSLGEFINPGAAVFELADVNNLRARLSFPESLASQVLPGQAAELISAAAPDAPVAAQISALQPSISAGNRMITAIIDFKNPGGLRPGASVRGQIVARARADAVIVPPLAVVKRPDGDVVYTLDDGIARQRRVITGLKTPHWVEIRQGLVAGETVVHEGSAFLTDGASVHVREPLS